MIVPHLVVKRLNYKLKIVVGDKSSLDASEHNCGIIASFVCFL